ncbi:MAG TPA: chorion class high-cysteine HCB protein 13 [Candidatus Blautia ornithocaccae]|uniref:Chorion class high-cysteine HCB protein 13 n=1 Tax=Candidatus Blautia merdigallinarum TaxID=2838495 RepID=A0A9D2SJX0_9FIRM|nr:chorion class high-cysteine HCB protein 13 [Blautia sp. An81]OUN24798.1 chorion class high-cysteine HCB protein 13 [Blautia sp. An81]HJC09555.1 chorion class high-cysteine HCB protein 13 [Candidatus Blautia merdigallinarum]HJD37859.1 chorion class high-cysteine HCB protein 13 [Candidatus Blautia ornithocaccae]
MSDLAATNCGCGCDDNCGGGMSRGLFGGGCSCIIWILLLLSCCGNGNTFSGNDGCSDSSCLILILLLLCGCGNGCGNGCC